MGGEGAAAQVNTTMLAGAEVVAAMGERIRAEASRLKAQGIAPTLAIIRVGERGDDLSYERGATRRAEALGVACRLLTLPEQVGTEELVTLITGLNDDAEIHGVLMFRPLPRHIDEDRVRNALDPQKDIDCITDLSLAGVFSGSTKGFAPCTPRACLELLDHYGIEPAGKRVVVVGRSLVVGKPVAMMLLGRNATVTLAHSRTERLPELTRAADIVVACVGRAQMLTADYLSSGQVVIDVGINVVEGGTLVGDVEYAAAEGLVGALTPVPGGVGTVTTSVLVKQVVEAARQQSTQDGV